MANSASTQAKMGLVEQAAQLAEQAHQIARASNETVSMRVLQMQVTLAHRLRDVGRYGRALDVARRGARRLCAPAAPRIPTSPLAEQRLVVLYQHLGQPARALPLLAPDRPGVPRGVAMIRLAHRAELEAQMGRDGLALMREALQIIPNADDIFHRIATLFATRLVPADEGEALAANLALWATTRERHGVALSGHVRAAACALALGAPARALPHVEAALRLATRYLPDSFYLPELWLVSAQTFATLGREPAARRAAADGQRLGRAKSTTSTCRPSSATASCTATRSTASCWRCRSAERRVAPSARGDDPLGQPHQAAVAARRPEQRDAERRAEALRRAAARAAGSRRGRRCRASASPGCGSPRGRPRRR